MLAQLVYASSAVRPLDEVSLGDILRASRRNNADADVTGALVYSGGNFMQVLEGRPEAVDAVFRRVQGDARHRGVLVMLQGEVAERSFPDWAMGCRIASPGAAGAEMRSLFDLTASGPTRAQRMLAAFRHTIGADA